MRQDEVELLRNIKKNHSRLKQLLDSVSESSEDEIYRFYHQSFKVYRLQQTTERVVEALRELLPERKFNERFVKLVKEGTGKQFSDRDARD